MKLTTTHLKKIIREEVQKTISGKKNLSEAMTRITQEEVEAWKKGNWGFVSESDSYAEATREELIEWCLGILQDPTTPIQKLKEVYNLLAKDPMGPRQPSLKDLIRDKFSSK